MELSRHSSPEADPGPALAVRDTSQNTTKVDVQFSQMIEANEKPRRTTDLLPKGSKEQRGKRFVPAAQKVFGA